MEPQDTETGLRAAIAQMLPELRAAARLLTLSRAEADDLVQESVLRMLRALGTFTPDPERGLEPSLKSWGLVVLRNTFREQYRRRARERRHAEREAAESSPGQEGAQQAREDLRDLSRALANLPPALREAVVLVGARGLGHEEAAEICGVPVGTMKARLARARRALANALTAVKR